jgi:hypothetical protein
MGREVDSAREYRKSFLTASNEVANEVAGRWWRTRGREEGKTQPENVLFAYAAFMMPEVAYSSPTPRVKAKRPAMHQDVAEAMQHAAAHWASPQGSDFLAENELCCWEGFSGHAVMRVGVEPMTNGAAAADLAIYSERVPRKHFLIDGDGLSKKKGRWIGHEYFRDLDDIQNAEWADPAAVESLVQEYSQKDDRGEGSHSTPDRKLVRLIDIYVPAHKILLTLAQPQDSAKAVFLRPPRPFWGPGSGPYAVLNYYDIPDEPLGMGPLQAIFDQYEELNAHLRAAGTEAATAKTITFVDASAPEIEHALKTGDSGGVYAVKDLKDKIQVVQTGVVTAGRLDYAQSVRDRFDRVIGFSDAQRGRATGGTATESQIVQSNADMRTEWLRKKALEFVTEILSKVCWYLFNDPNVVMELSVPDPMTGMDQGATFMGGPQPGQEELNWSDFNLEIDPQSMQRQDDGTIQQRWLQLIEMTPILYQMLTAMPGVNVRWLIDQYGASINQPKLSELLFRDLLMMPPGMVPGMQPNQPSGMTPPHLGMMEAGVPPNGQKPGQPFGMGGANPMSAGGMMPGGQTPIQRNPMRLQGGRQPSFAA